METKILILIAMFKEGMGVRSMINGDSNSKVVTTLQWPEHELK